MVRLAPVMVSVAVFSLTPVHARADAPATSATDPGVQAGQRTVGIAAEIGANTGLGAALHVGTPVVGAYVAVGIAPVFVFGNEQTASRSLTFDVYGALAVNADLYALVVEASPRARIGPAGGYSHNSVLGDGFNAGVAVRYELGDKLAVSLFGGIEVFPDARDRLVAHGYPMDQDPALPQVQGGLTVGLVFYP